jgi:hypothetical protein
MTAIAHARNTTTAGQFPSKGTLAVAANTLCFRGTIACVDSDGRTTPGALNAGLNAAGIYASTYDNRTTAPDGGGAGAIDAEIEYGVFELLYSGTAPTSGAVLFVLDNQTVTLDSNGGARGIAGQCVEVTATGKCTVWMGPHVVGMIAVGAVVAADLDTAEAAIDVLEVDAATANAYVHIPLTSFTAADGTPLAKFASGDDTTFGLNIADSEALCIRWNNHATPGTALCQLSLPVDLDDAAPAQLEFLCSKSGATIGDATTLTLTAFITAAGDLHDADLNCGGVSDALVGDATAKTTKKLTRTIAAADIPESAHSLTFTVTPTAGKLGTDDLLLHSARLRYTRKVQTA